MKRPRSEREQLLRGTENNLEQLKHSHSVRKAGWVGEVCRVRPQRTWRTMSLVSVLSRSLEMSPAVESSSLMTSINLSCDTKMTMTWSLFQVSRTSQSIKWTKETTCSEACRSIGHEDGAMGRPRKGSLSSRLSWANF